MNDRNYRHSSGKTMTFWEHLDVFRGFLVKMALITLIFSVVAFFFKDAVFSVILAPKHDDFFIYSFLSRISSLFADTSDQGFEVGLINTGLAEQFKIHIKVSLFVGFLLSSPYCIFALFRFISPALYAHEKKYTRIAVVWGYLLFMAGVLLCYFLIFPLTFRFLGTYQVSDEVTNMITLQSYMDTLLVMSFLMGVLFELPMLCWLLGTLGFLSIGFMRRYRKHAFVLILVVAAIITPTSDVFTLCLVALPICLLYEVSIWVVGFSNRRGQLKSTIDC